MLRVYRRFFVVAYRFLPILLGYARDRRRFLLFGGPRSVQPAERRRRARKLLDSMIRLGPTFIKLGQLLSTRPDILPPEYVDEFTELQDRVPPAPWPGAKRVLEAELGPVEEAFDDFDTDAISGASLGQVYVARYSGAPDADRGAEDADRGAEDAGRGAENAGSRRVAVKVRRPNVESLVEADLRIITFSLPFLMRFVGDAQSFSLETLADEFATVIREEMDYEREARMLEEIRANFADEDAIRIPRVVHERSTGRVLTMEYVPGTKITAVDAIDELGLDRSRLAETLQRVYLKMIVDDGVFHADPHPGNLAVQPDGTLVFYDFGMSGHVDSYVQERIIAFYAAVARQDIEAILDSLIEMGTLSPEADRDTMANVMELAIADARGEDIEHYRVQQIVSQVEDTIYEFPLRLPPNLALVLRVATVVEGVCVTLDPDFDFIAVATGFLDDHGYLERGVREFVDERVDELNEAVQSSVRVPPKLERTLDRVERDNLVVKARLQDPDGLFDRLARRLVAGLFLTATVISTAYLYAQTAYYAAAVAGAFALLTTAVLYRSFRKRKTGIRAHPQFTRQTMRQRERSEGDSLVNVGGAERGMGSPDRQTNRTAPGLGDGDRESDATGHRIDVTDWDADDSARATDESGPETSDSGRETGDSDRETGDSGRETGGSGRETGDSGREPRS